MGITVVLNNTQAHINGILVPAKDSEALANALRVLIEDKELRSKMGKAARLKAEREFSLQHVVNRHLEIYDKIRKQ
jgi:glycosyltransferase involved in cell wall biosynthesis